MKNEKVNESDKEVNQVDTDNLISSFLEPDKPGIVEIYPGMTSEEMVTLFFDRDALIEPPYKVYQLNSHGHRYYYRNDNQGNPQFFPSVTTILSQTLPKTPGLIEWIASKGIEEAERYKNERANYGTFMHAQFEELLINRTYDLDKVKEKLKDFIEVNRLPDNFIYEADNLKRDILSFAQFVIDYDVKPLAVEIALVHPEFGYAGMIDCPCTMLAKMGCDQRINAIVDFKSGRKGFWEECEIQLAMYRDLWNVNFKDFPIERVFNFSPKDWRKKPSYNLKDQTNSVNAEKVSALLQLAAIEDKKRENVFTAVFGSISLDNRDLSQNIVSLTLHELIKSKQKTGKKPGKGEGIDTSDLKTENTPEKKPEKTKKTRIVKRKPVKTTKKVSNKAIEKEKPKRRVNSRTTKKNAPESKKEGKKEVNDLLNEDIEL